MHIVPNSTDEFGSQTPFRDAALDYRRAGWLGVIPLRVGDKRPEVSGYHGLAAPWPDGTTIRAWRDQYGSGNLGLRLAGVDCNHEVIGIDVDHYHKGGKSYLGFDQLIALERKLGALPATWTSSARSDGRSGIRYFRVLRGLSFKGKADKDIEVISKGNRFAAVWPSRHPTEGTYWWFPPGMSLTVDGRESWDGVIPDPRTLPLLPHAWIEFLTNDHRHTGVIDVDLNASVSQLDEWAEDVFNDGSAEAMCEQMRNAIETRRALIHEEANSHDQATKFHWHAYQLAAEGHTGWAHAIQDVQDFYAREVIDRDKRGTREMADELFRSRTRALRKIKCEVEALGAFGVQSPPRQCVCQLAADPSPEVFARLVAQVEEWVAGQPKPIVTNPAGNEVHSGQVRMAHRLASRHHNSLVYVNGVGWHFWDGKRWAFDDRGKAKRAVVAVLKSAWNEAFAMTDADAQKRLMADTKASSSAAGITGVLSIAAALEPFAATVRDLDADPYAINLANGTLNLKTFELRPHHPDDGITKTCRGVYDPETIVAGSPWDQFLTRILPDHEVRAYVQRLAGISLLGKVKEHILPVLTGEGRNGKGTFYEALLYAFGDYGSTAEPDLFMHREGAHPTGEMDLRGKRLVVVSENDRDRRLAEATMKRLTGGDPIKARYMRENFVEFIPSHLAMLVTNHLPRVNGDDPAIWARMRVVPFEVVIPRNEQDTNLGEKLEAQADVVLAWAVAGLKDYLRRGTAEPQRVLTATNRYRTDSDDVGRWMRECCVTDPRAHLVLRTSTELHHSWEEWRTEDGCPKLGLKAFGKILDAKGHHVLPARHGRRERDGIGLTTPSSRDGLNDVNRSLA